MTTTPTPGQEAISFIEQDGEWRTRKITLFGVVRSFISEVKVGQDMTRVSLPATLLYPFSMLEVFSARELGVFHLLFKLNTEEDPFQRMLQVVRWSLGFIQQESWHKKPSNPVLGEVLETYNETAKNGRSDFIGEQVSHHPPVSAFIIKNENENISLECNISFGVKFGSNFVTIVTDGSGFINVDKRNEQYELVRKTPGMVIKNVIWGTRKMFWAGDVCITCPKTGLTVNLVFKESGNDNVVNGTVVSTDPEGNEEELCKITGKCGGEIFITHKGSKDKEFFFDAGAIQKPQTHYKKWDELDALSSQNVWNDVNRFSVADDMPNADASKKEVEQAQRERSQKRKENGEENLAKYFEQSESEKIWVYKYKKKPAAAILPPAVAQPAVVSTMPNIYTQPNVYTQPNPLALSSTTSQSQIVGEDGAVHSTNPHVASYMASLQGQANTSSSNLHSLMQSHPVTITPTLIGGEEESRKRQGTLGAKDKAQFMRFSSQIQDKTASPRVLPSSLEGGRIPKLADDVNLITGWVKMRNSMKIWINRWFALRPGKLIYFKDDKEMLKGRCVGIVRLADCHIRTRPTHKDGFSFKIWHIMNYPIYHKYGLKGESLKMAKLPVGWNYCILRVGSETERKAWMDAIEQQIEYANTYDPNPGRGALLEDVVDEDDMEPERGQTAEELMSRNEEFQRQLLDGLSTQQRTNNVSLQSHTIQQMSGWKIEVDSKLVNMEKRIMASISSRGGKEDGKLRLSYLQLFLVIIAAFLIARFI